METNRIIPGQSQPPTKLSGAQQQDGEQAFHDLAKSKGNSKEELALATSERTRLTRTRRIERNKTKSISSLFKILNEGDLEEEAIYYTVLDPTTGQILTLRLLAVA